MMHVMMTDLRTQREDGWLVPGNSWVLGRAGSGGRDKELVTRLGKSHCQIAMILP